MSKQQDKFAWGPDDIEFTLVRKHAYARDLTPSERRVDFAAIERLYSADAVEAATKIRQLIKPLQKETLELIERTATAGGLTAQFVASLRLVSVPELTRVIQDYLMLVWRKGRDTAFEELPEQLQIELGALKRYVQAFVPDKALDYLLTKSIQIKGVIDRDIEEAVRFDLFEHIKGGRPLQETIKNVRSIFEPFVGDPEKIVSSGLTGMPEDILQAYRLENIIRTETTESLNMGRRAIGDAAEDFVLGYELSAILDERTTEICVFADGLKVRNDDERSIQLTPPLHFQCRTILIFLTTNDTPIKWAGDAAVDKAVRLAQKGFK